MQTHNSQSIIWYASKWWISRTPHSGVFKATVSMMDGMMDRFWVLRRFWRLLRAKIELGILDFLRKKKFWKKKNFVDFFEKFKFKKFVFLKIHKPSVFFRIFVFCTQWTTIFSCFSFSRKSNFHSLSYASLSSRNS